MVYKTQQIKPASFPQIKGVQITKQQEIIEQTGAAFDPIQALQIIKEASSGYSTPNPDALKADSMYIAFLENNGIKIVDTQPKPKTKREPKPKSPTKDDYIKALEGVEVLLEFADEAKKKDYQKAIEGYRVMIEIL